MSAEIQIVDRGELAALPHETTPLHESASGSVDDKEVAL
jgi:hypothetical protein